MDLKLLVFDLDGTLVDSRLDLVHSVNGVLASLGREKLPVETITSFVGDGAQDLLRRSLEASGVSAEEAQAMMPEAYPAFMDYYQNHCLDFTLPYPGVVSVLERFPDCRKAVLTNKPMIPTLKILEGLVIRDYFSLIVGGDGPHGKKPDPAGLAYILSTLEALPSETIMIGDSMQDWLTAKALDCGFVAFLDGLGDRKALQAASPDSALENWNQFPELLIKMGGTF